MFKNLQISSYLKKCHHKHEFRIMHSKEGQIYMEEHMHSPKKNIPCHYLFNLK